MSLTLQDYRNWLERSGVTRENVNATMLAAQNAVRDLLAAYRARAVDSSELFELHFGDERREERTGQSVENQVVTMLLKQEQQEQFAAAVLLQPGDAYLPSGEGDIAVQTWVLGHLKN